MGAVNSQGEEEVTDQQEDREGAWIDTGFTSDPHQSFNACSSPVWRLPNRVHSARTGNGKADLIDSGTKSSVCLAEMQIR
jgi:hypothetical protein